MTSVRRGPTIRDVARLAGVSAATVSRVLNDSPLVVESTRERVRAAVDQLGYRLNATARTLSSGQAQAIGVVVPFLETHSVTERLRGVVERLRRCGYDLLLADVEAPDQRADAMRDLARRGRVAGLLFVSLPVLDHEVDALVRDELPVVLLDVRHPRLPHVVIDNVRGGELAAAHLLARGHERMAFVGDHPTNVYGFTSSEDRRRGFRAALQSAGIPAAAERLTEHGREAACAAARSLLEAPEPPTAVFAASDVQALGVLQAAAEARVRVPEELAVIGFDDVDLAEIVGLTTVRQPLREGGALAADLLLAGIAQGVFDPVSEVLELAVVERRTT